MKGYWIPVLHSHLPFVKHPEHDYFLEEHWLFEAISETYIPLLMRFRQLESEGVDFAMTTSITPPLAEMLDDKHLMDKYLSHLNRMLELCHKEIARCENDPHFHEISHFYLDRFTKIREFFVGFLDFNVLNGYRYFANRGNLEIITCGATHGYLPLLSVNPKIVETQISIAVDTHKKHFGVQPNGIWLPECAYYDGLDEVLAKYNIKFFLMDSHGLVYAKPTPKYGVFAPIYTPQGVMAFGRDPESSKQVWSSKEGYPGDVDYRDFYRDVGFDLDYEYIKPYICPDGTRVFVGLKYHRVTGEAEFKEVYNPANADYKARAHAANFHQNRVAQIEHISQFVDDRLPVVVSPYDAELFGHWWFEGPDFLYYLFKELDARGEIKAITPMQYQSIYPSNQVCTPNPSSWGDKRYYDVWLNNANDWIYRHLHRIGDLMCELANQHKHNNNHFTTRVLNQLCRELLLAQSSDWAFLMTTKTAVEYSTKRTKEHISNFLKLSSAFARHEVDEQFLLKLEDKNSIFPHIDFRVYCD